MCPYNWHHYRPISRGGKNGKTVQVPVGFHEAFHAVFGNLYGRECEQFLQMVNRTMETKRIITTQDLEMFRRVSRGANNSRETRPG